MDNKLAECTICKHNGKEFKKEESIVQKHLQKKHTIWDVYQQLRRNGKNSDKLHDRVYFKITLVATIMWAFLLLFVGPLMAIMGLLMLILMAIIIVVISLQKLRGTIRGCASLWLYKNG